jgi:hypothetical protein
VPVRLESDDAATVAAMGALCMKRRSLTSKATRSLRRVVGGDAPIFGLGGVK